MDLQLSYPAPLPSWSSSNHPCIVPRPFLTPHQSERHRTPRLFPVQLSAHALYRAISPARRPRFVFEEAVAQHRRLCGAAPAVSDALLASLAAEHDMERAVPAWRAAPRNAMCALNDGESGAAVVAFSTSGLLRDVALWRGRLVENETRDEFTRQSTAASVAGDDEVYDIVGVDDKGQGGLVAVRLSRTVALARYAPGALDLQWIERIPIPDGAVTCALNHTSMLELCTLDQYALRVFDISTSSPLQCTDLQALSPRARFNWLRYGAHPRTLLLASQQSISRIDLREKANPIQLLHTNQLNLHTSDSGLLHFSAHPTHNFRCILATETLLAISDERMLRHPILEWHIPTGHAPSAMATSCALDATPRADIVLALSNPGASELSILHATTGHNFTMGITGPADSTLNLGDFRLQHPDILWSDLPLRHLDRFGPRALATAHGIALARHNDSRVSVVQAVPGRAVISQLLGVQPYEDGTHIFEPPKLEDTVEDAVENTVENRHAGVVMDSVANILNQIDAGVVAEKEERVDIARNMMGCGVKRAGEIRKLDARDASLLMWCVVGADDDEMGDEGCVPRACLSSLERYEMVTAVDDSGTSTQFSDADSP